MIRNARTRRILATLVHDRQERKLVRAIVIETLAQQAVEQALLDEVKRFILKSCTRQSRATALATIRVGRFCLERTQAEAGP